MPDQPKSPEATATGPVGYEADLTAERYYRGTIIKLHEGSQRGVVLGSSGRKIPFSFMFVSMVGSLRQFSDLRIGLEIGYDVSHTSHGLRVSTIRIPEPSPVEGS